MFREHIICFSEGKEDEAIELTECGMNYYSRRIENAINPYAEMDSGMIILVLRHIVSEMERNHPESKEFADGMEKYIKLPAMTVKNKCMRPNRW